MRIERNTTELKAHTLSNRWAQGEYNYSVFATLEISFNAIERQQSAAAEAFLTCELFGNDGIWEGLLFGQGRSAEDGIVTLCPSVVLPHEFDLSL